MCDEMPDRSIALSPLTHTCCYDQEAASQAQSLGESLAGVRRALKEAEKGMERERVEKELLQVRRQVRM